MRFTDILMSSAHAFIVEGRSGEARDRFVRDFIRGLNCEAEDVELRPCNCCAACRQVDAGTNMDVVHMERSGKTGYRVDDAASLIERIGMGSYGRHIIGVIDDADLLTETVQNKLLKTLEEPEPGTVLILAASNRENLLRTVRSRCNAIRITDVEGYQDEDERTASENISELARLLTGSKFYECRQAIDKKLKSQDEAIELLGVMEDICRGRMINGENTGDMVKMIDLIEIARRDIYRGMIYSKALRRLALELA